MMAGEKHAPIERRDDPAAPRATGGLRSRRDVLSSAMCGAVALALPGNVAALEAACCVSPRMAARQRAMKWALEDFESAFRTTNYEAPWHRVIAAVEAVFTTEPENAADEDAVMDALAVYETEVAPSSFTARTARDLFTPLRHQSSPDACRAIREWLLTDPNEAFAKCDMPWFLSALRKA